MGLEHLKKRKLSIKYGRRYKKKKKFEMDLKWFEHFSKTLKKYLELTIVIKPFK